MNILRVVLIATGFTLILLVIASQVQACGLPNCPDCNGNGPKTPRHKVEQSHKRK